jgi:hypothetical protein
LVKEAVGVGQMAAENFLRKIKWASKNYSNF